MPKKYKIYATAVIYFEKSEEVCLFAKLKDNGFKVTGGWPIQEIHHKSMPADIAMGQIDLFYGRCRLYVLNVEGNPLEKFVEQYDSLSLGPLPRRHSRAK